MWTIVVQIGNSDDKLKQSEWSQFVHQVRECVHTYAHCVHFDGAANLDAPQQNACWVADLDDSNRDPLRDSLRTLRQRYRQDSIAFTLGSTEFL